MFRKTQTDNLYLYSTDVENFFISEFMIKAPGEYVKAYLLALMFAKSGSSVDNESLKRQLSMDSEEIESCWAYWEDLGAIKRINCDDPDAGYDVEFVNLRELVSNSSFAPASRSESNLDDKELVQLFKNIQIITSRMIEGREMAEITSWIDEYNISTELILFCYKYCAEKRKSTAYRYVGTILRDWVKQGIRTADQAQAFLGESDNRFAIYKNIFSEMGFSRNPTAEEKRLMNSWLDEYKFSLNDILTACKQTAGISNPNLKYVDAVLKNTKGSAEETKRENIAISINRIYEKRRAENARNTKENREKIFSQIPRLKDILLELGNVSIKQSQALLHHDGISLKEIRNKINNLQEEKNKLLQNAGYEINALDAIYTCHKCKDTGVLEDGSTCSCYGEILEEVNGK